ncbi:MAG: rRNA maturation RNase YbeY [Candidatus Nealsonbacteria bacterium]
MIEINNLSKKKIDIGFLKKIGENVLKEEKRSDLEISGALIGQSDIKEINKKYRRKNKPTDVLSFLYGGSGEILICLDMVKGGKEGLSRVFIHGLLHVLGYDHEKTQKEAKAMEQKENYYLSQKHGKK